MSTTAQLASDEGHTLPAPETGELLACLLIIARLHGSRPRSRR